MPQKGQVLVMMHSTGCTLPVHLPAWVRNNSDWSDVLCCVMPVLLQVNNERVGVQELQASPMGVIELVYPNTSSTQSRLGIDIFEQVRSTGSKTGRTLSSM